DATDRPDHPARLVADRVRSVAHAARTLPARRLAVVSGAVRFRCGLFRGRVVALPEARLAAISQIRPFIESSPHEAPAGASEQSDVLGNLPAAGAPGPGADRRKLPPRRARRAHSRSAGVSGARLLPARRRLAAGGRRLFAELPG